MACAMKILASGCSFTGDKNSWAHRLQVLGHNVTNLGLSAAGNRYITDITIRELLLHKNSYDYVLVMWSGLTRFDFFVDAAVIDMYPSLHWRAKKITDNFGFVTGGALPDNAHPVSVSIKKELELVTNYELRAYQSLLEMIKLQSFLKHNKISYKFMSYVNYWNDDDFVVNNNFGVNKFKSLSLLIDNIDFSNFIFYNNNKDGIYEMCSVMTDGLGSDNFHPSTSGYNAWGDIVNNTISIGNQHELD